jgi:hypothetical protein
MACLRMGDWWIDGSRMLDAPCSMLAAGYSILDAGCSILGGR